MAKKPLVKRGATIKHDNHYEAPKVEINNVEKKTTKKAKPKTIALKRPEVYATIRAIVKSGLATDNSEAVTKAVNAYVNGLDEIEKQKVRKIVEAIATLESL